MLYHIEFGQPPQPKLVQQWNLLKDDLEVLAKRFRLISLESVGKGRPSKSPSLPGPSTSTGRTRTLSHGGPGLSLPPLMVVHSL